MTEITTLTMDVGAVRFRHDPDNLSQAWTRCRHTFAGDCRFLSLAAALARWAGLLFACGLCASAGLTLLALRINFSTKYIWEWKVLGIVYLMFFSLL
jgi:hypothetical protein